ncbi:MAG TPA: fatty acid--CoA ligase [Syntrophales bacterium]|nr:fatty acid--CoA ligase [Syntrophales bacterium]HRT70149.1 fatty acid--CoA ligase [Syntrophales bacterium]
MAGKVYQPGESYKYPLIIKKLLLTPIIYSPNKEIVYRDKARFTYRTLYERINRLASGLEKLGVKQGDTVCVFDYDSNRYLECYFAVPMMGAVLHTMNWRLSPEQILYTMNHAEDDVVLINSDFLPVLEEIWDKLTTVKKVVLLTDEDKKPATKLNIDIEYEEMLRGASPTYDFPDLDENTKATTFYTTATTGLPKGVYFSHRQLVLHTMCTALMVGSYESIGRFRSRDVYMPLTPMFHAHAWGIPYVATLLAVKQVYPGKYEPEVLLKLILGEKVTFSHCVPTIIHMLVTSPVAKKVDLSHWKVIIGGAALPKGLAKAAMDLGIEIYAGFGMSETCPVVTIANLKEHMLDWDADKKVDVLIKTGLPLPLAELKVVDSQGNELPHDGKSTGELVMRVPYLTESYFKDPEKTKELWRDGWLHGGDVAYIDEEGYVQITDRMKDVIKTGGEWISSLDLESLTSQFAGVSEAAAIGIPDEKWGERPMMVVVLKPEFKGKVSADDLKQFLKKFADEGRLPKYGIPDKYVFVDAIPKTSVGKINKIELRKMYI